MADRQPSSSSSQPHHQPANYKHHYSDQSHKSTTNVGNYRQNERPKHFEPASKKRFNTEQRPVTNQETEDGKRVMAIFCQYNPQHVVGERNRKDHEQFDCPDRGWQPGQPRLKYTDLDI